MKPSGEEHDQRRCEQLAQQRQLPRKERRKLLRVQQQLQKRDHQGLRKQKRLQRKFNAVNPQEFERDGNNRASARQDSGVAWDATLSDTTKMNSSGASYEACRLPLRSGSTDAAVAAPKNLKQKQQQERENDALHHELQMLEARLGINNKKGCKKSSNANAKLRRELEADGFDLELQDILDNILVRHVWL